MSCSPATAPPSSQHLRGFRRVLGERLGSRRRVRHHGPSWRSSRSSALRVVFRVGGGDSPDLTPGGQLLPGSWGKAVADIYRVAKVIPRWPGGAAAPAVLWAVPAPPPEGSPLSWLMDERRSLLTGPPRHTALQPEGLASPPGRILD